jgi:hypothetical protein
LVLCLNDIKCHPSTQTNWWMELKALTCCFWHDHKTKWNSFQIIWELCMMDMGRRKCKTTTS